MESCLVDKQIKDSLFNFVKTYNPSAQVSDIDEIVLSYVAGILEDLGSNPDSQDIFDVDDFSEMLSAYLPDFIHIDHDLVSKWIFQLSSQLNESKNKEDNDLEKGEVRINLSCSLSSSSGRSRHNSSECSDGIFPNKNRNHLLSETSDASSDSGEYSSGHDDSFISYDVQMLQEMFPRVSIMELRHCLTAAEGDVELAAQIVLHRQEAGQSITNINLLQCANKKQAINDEELKNRIIARYSYVAKDDDVREHRPVAPKSEPKKLVRYRDNKIVSMKGERYTEVKKDDADETAGSGKSSSKNKTRLH